MLQCPDHGSAISSGEANPWDTESVFFSALRTELRQTRRVAEPRPGGRSREIPAAVSSDREDVVRLAYLLKDTLNRLQGSLNPSRTFTVNSCTTLTAALAALPKHQFEVVCLQLRCELDVCAKDFTILRPDQGRTLLFRQVPLLGECVETNHALVTSLIRPPRGLEE